VALWCGRVRRPIGHGRNQAPRRLYTRTVCVPQRWPALIMPEIFLVVEWWSRCGAQRCSAWHSVKANPALSLKRAEDMNGAGLESSYRLPDLNGVGLSVGSRFVENFVSSGGWPAGASFACVLQLPCCSPSLPCSSPRRPFLAQLALLPPAAIARRRFFPARRRWPSDFADLYMCGGIQLLQFWP